MLAIGFAALLGIVLGRFFKVAVLAPGVAATAIFAALIEQSHGAGALWTLAAAAAATLCLQLGYLVGSTTGRPASRPRLYPPAPAKLEISADL
jgi:hypothetical protein